MSLEAVRDAAVSYLEEEENPLNTYDRFLEDEGMETYRSDNILQVAPPEKPYRLIFGEEEENRVVAIEGPKPSLLELVEVYKPYETTVTFDIISLPESLDFEVKPEEVVPEQVEYVKNDGNWQDTDKIKRSAFNPRLRGKGVVEKVREHPGVPRDRESEFLREIELGGPDGTGYRSAYIEEPHDLEVTLDGLRLTLEEVDREATEMMDDFFEIPRAESAKSKLRETAVEEFQDLEKELSTLGDPRHRGEGHIEYTDAIRVRAFLEGSNEAPTITQQIGAAYLYHEFDENSPFKEQNFEKGGMVADLWNKKIARINQLVPKPGGAIVMGKPELYYPGEVEEPVQEVVAHSEKLEWTGVPENIESRLSRDFQTGEKIVELSKEATGRVKGRGQLNRAGKAAWNGETDSNTNQEIEDIIELVEEEVPVRE